MRLLPTGLYCVGSGPGHRAAIVSANSNTEWSPDACRLLNRAVAFLGLQTLFACARATKPTTSTTPSTSATTSRCQSCLRGRRSAVSRQVSAHLASKCAERDSCRMRRSERTILNEIVARFKPRIKSVVGLFSPTQAPLVDPSSIGANCPKAAERWKTPSLSPPGLCRTQIIA